ncbi:MAG: aldo/keto reductase [Chloroflexi bacterium]|nr:aldo/keto reductase [Chloroflexota bacterium]
MEYRNLGRTGLKVSQLCLGCMTFGWGANDETSMAIMQRAVDGGINFFDTADVYGGGHSEEVVGQFLKGRRQQIVLATKVRGRKGEGPNDEGLSRLHIIQGVEASLRRLNTDYIDLYQVHAPDPSTPLEETMSALNDLVRQGKVRYLGCSNFAAWQICKANWIADVRNFEPFVCVQPRYSLLDRGIEHELIPFCIQEGVGNIPYSPLAGGMLTGKYRRGESPAEGTRAARSALMQDRMLTERNFRAVERLAAKARQMDVTLAQLALAWVCRQKGVSSPIVGASSVAQLEETLPAVDVTLGDGDLKELDELTK